MMKDEVSPAFLIHSQAGKQHRSPLYGKMLLSRHLLLHLPDHELSIGHLPGGRPGSAVAGQLRHLRYPVPQLIAGPIIKYKDLGDQIDSRTCTVEKFASGVQMFVIGLGKKVLIANNVGMLWESYKAMAPGDLTVAGAWLGVLAFAIQIYFDFSGYSDMAVGLGRMLGFEFMRNFNYPYISRSITEFWRRWHITLSTWFREYLYIPLGATAAPRGPVGPESVPGVGGHRHLARGQLELRALGIVLLVLLLVEKFVLLRWLKRAPVR